MYLLSLSPSPSFVARSSSPCFPSLSHSHTIRHPTHTFPPSKIAAQAEMQPPSLRACTPTHNYSGELGKPDVNLDLMRSKSEALRLKALLFWLLSQSAVYRNWQRWKESEEKETGREGRAPQIGSFFIVTALCSALMPCSFYKGLFHLFSRHLLASCNMRCNVKDKQLPSNSYLPTFFHLMSVHWK